MSLNESERAFSQSKLVNSNPGPIYTYYREIQSSNLKDTTKSDDSQIRRFREVIDGFDRITGINPIDEIELDENAELVINDLFQSYPDREPRLATMLINNFCKSMNTSARQEGKYAILVILGDSIFVAHADSKEKTITKDANVIERLLDTDNVDKYAEFRKTDSGKISVRHFERQRTESLSGWLGVEPSRMTFESAGEIEVFTQIDDATVSFQFTQEEFESKFLSKETYDFRDNAMITPNSNEYHVDQISFGKRKFDSVDEFLQDFHSIYYDVESYREHYSNIANSVSPFTDNLIDAKKEVRDGNSYKTHVKKQHSDFNILFSNNSIDLSAKWRSEMIDKFESGKTMRLFHAGHPFSEDPARLGSLEIFNDIKVDTLEHINKVYDVIRDAKTGTEFTNILSYIMLEVFSSQISTPLQYTINQIQAKYRDRVNSDGLIIKSEDSMIEYKDRDWFAVDSPTDLANRFTKEIQSETRLVIGGISERTQRINTLDKSKFDPEFIRGLEDELLRLNGDHEEVSVEAVPLGPEECLLFVFSVRGHNAAPDMSMFDL